ncbi:MAG: ribbon-helix-helix protein, CopG family [Actinomycetota bacterium]|nr:ribbon-helix-helix protein, CopG family [Actinomycetota bacterium]
MSEHLAPAGADAFSAPPTPTAPPPLPSPGRSDPDRRWEDTHSRVTFYCPAALLAAVEAEVAMTDRSKTQVIVDALRAALTVDGTR